MIKKNASLWDRSFGRSRNKIALPAGWYQAETSVPATMLIDDEGRAALTFINDQPGVIDVLILGHKR